ncbi:MAG: Unknown protein [uncultured Sulfurovum sp.]|uniref:Uncharacterized protein n=1 Tax=uncultured Sulfurovum sp. TaxID=269237 RepID=A0A6S6SLU4_9BACT|nr:MAG: Unknown protein [uncultured Sulfurovum sp.]
MKKITLKVIILLLSPLLFTLGLNAQNSVSGSTFHQYSKPGAPVDMSFETEEVGVDEVSDVNISLSTSSMKGTLSVLITVDKDLESLKEFDKDISFEIKPTQQNFLIDLQVKAKKEGLYYIRLLTKIDKGYGPKLRSFAVPVYVGKSSNVLNENLNTRMKALGSGENISVSKAVETIKILKEK